MKNIEAILVAAGCSFKDVVKTTILCALHAQISASSDSRPSLADIADFGAVNEIYGRRWPSEPPARSTFAVAALPKAARVEIECTAVLP
jgi:2-iminobutanoate/2-iminopropanoate deaminase